MGRPPKRVGERLAKNRTFRVRGELDTKLQTAADTSGRSVSEEIEYRLERSFDRSDRLAEVMEAARQVSGGGKWDYPTYVLVNVALGYKPRSHEEWEAMTPAPTAEEFEDMKRRHGGVAKRDPKK